MARLDLLGLRDLGLPSGLHHRLGPHRPVVRTVQGLPAAQIVPSGLLLLPVLAVPVVLVPLA